MPGQDTNPETVVANAIEEARRSGLITDEQDVDPVHVMILLKIARGEIPAADAFYRISKVGAKKFAKEAGIIC